MFASLRRWLTVRSISTDGRGGSGCGLTRTLRYEPLERRTLLAVDLVLGGTQDLIRPPSIPQEDWNVNVSQDSEAFQSEMILDVNPTNPLNLAGFSHRADPYLIDYPFNEIDVFHSEDGGATWTTTSIDDGTVGIDDGRGEGRRFDPSLAFDADGMLFVAYGHASVETTSVVVGRSADGGASFLFTVADTQDNFTTTNPPGYWLGVDKFHLATGLDPSTGNQAVYVAYGQFVMEPLWMDQRIVVTGSNDGGVTFVPPEIINDLSWDWWGSLGECFADPAVGPNGELYVSWHHHTNPYGERPWDDDLIKFDVNLDGLFSVGSTWGTDVVAVELYYGLWRTSVYAQPRRGIFNGPVLDVDRSGGAYDGRLYLTYADNSRSQRPPATGISVTHSDNGGADWSEPVLVAPTSACNFLPWGDVDQITGSVNVIYYTTANDTSPLFDRPVDVRLATSLDGGLTFPTKRDLTTAQSNASQSVYPGEFLEYIGLAVHGGTAHGLWSDNRLTGDPPNQDDLEAYTASAAFESDTNGNLLTVTGDDGEPEPVVTNDNIILRRSEANEDFLEVVVNGTLQFAGLAATIDSIEVYGLGGDDAVALEGPLGISVHVFGGDGNDTAHFTGSDGTDTFTAQGSTATLSVNEGPLQSESTVEGFESVVLHTTEGDDVEDITQPLYFELVYDEATWNAQANGNWGTLNWADSRDNQLTAWPDGGFFLDAVVNTYTVTVAADRTVRDLTVESGQVNVNAGKALDVVRTLTLGAVEGYQLIIDDLEFDDANQYVVHLHKLGDTQAPVMLHGELHARDAVQLAGTLTLEALHSLGDVGSEGGWGGYTGTIISAEGSVSGEFNEVPPMPTMPPLDPLEFPLIGHLGRGVSITDLIDGEAVTYDSDKVTVDLFQAAAGDTNLDRMVNFDDLARLLASGKWNNPAAGPAVWTDGDFTGNELVNFEDFAAMLATGLWNQGVYWPETQGAAPEGGAGPLVSAAVDEVLFFAPADGKPGLIATRESLTIVDNLQLAAEELGWLDEFEQMIAQQRSTEADIEEDAINPLLI